MGRGQNLSLTIDTSSRRDDYSVSFTEPALFDRRLSGGIDIFNKEFEYDAFRSKRLGGSLRIGRGLGQHVWGRIGYKYENNDVTILDRDNASFFLISQEGQRTSGSIFPSITFDNLDDPFSPSKGKKMSGYLEVAGFGGDERFYKLTAEYTQYKSIFLDFVGMFHAKIGRADGYEDKELPVFESFFMGGPRSMRGFTLRDIGPLDENGEAIGGEALLQFNLELQYRFTRFFRGFVFYDRGNVYGVKDEQNNTTDKFYDIEDMRHSWGFGIHFFSPVGPISIVYGFKLDQRENETPSEFHFTIGGAF
jgi:outer membrane protein insertion porin family